MTSALIFQGVIIKHLGSHSSNVGLLSVTRHLVHILKMASQVSALCEGLVALGAIVGSLACVLAEVVAQIAAFLEDTFAATVHALEIEFDARRHLMFDLDGLMPLIGYAFERP